MIPLVKVAMPPPAVLLPALQEVLYGGQIGEGEPVYAFEQEFRAHFGLPHVLATSSGTGALHMALLLAGVRPGDEVVTTSMTAEPTNMAILHCGGVPVFADVDPDSGNLSPSSVDEAIGPKTRAIVVVHYSGLPARLRELRTIAERHGLPLVEDCAHALGAAYDGRPIGTTGAFSMFSFQAIKHMTTVDGGALAFRDGGLTDRAKKLRWFGLLKGVPRTEIDVDSVGYKYNMNNVTATIGRAQLAGIDALLDAHRRNGRWLDEAVARIPGLLPARFEPHADPSYWLFTLLCEDSADVERRLNEAGFAASKLHRPNHLHRIFATRPCSLPGLETYYRRMIHLPCGWWVTPEDRERMVAALSHG
jgi:perosamine synthetase